MRTPCKQKCFREGRTVALSLFIALSFAAVFMSGCSGEVKADQRLVETFVELRVIEIAYGANSPTTRLARQEVLSRYGYTREEYLSKIDKVLEDEDQWVPFQQAVTSRLDSLLAVPKKDDKTSPSVPKKGPPKTRKGSE